MFVRGFRQLADAKTDSVIFPCDGGLYTSTIDMTESFLPPLVIVADAPAALTDLCVVSLLGGCTASPGKSVIGRRDSVQIGRIHRRARR